MDYATYHLLGEPETTIEERAFPSKYLVWDSLGTLPNKIIHFLQNHGSVENGCNSNIRFLSFIWANYYNS